MTKDFNSLSKIAYIGVLVYFIWRVGELTWGWSISQTQVLTDAIFGNEYSMAGAWIIQLAPQALLAVVGVAMAKKQRNLALAMIVSALIINGIDTYTNIIGYRELWPVYQEKLISEGRSIDLIEAAYPLGIIFSFLVTWGEEVILLAAGTVIVLIVEVSEDIGKPLPNWFRSFGISSKTLGFGGSTFDAMATRTESNGRSPDNVTYGHYDNRPTHGQTQQRVKRRPMRVQK